jgi:glycosyltransferase involved in cell wall biosynthesis
LASIVIPAHNEARVIGRLLSGLLAGAEVGELEVIVVCNGCTDGTAEIARGAGPDVRVIELDEPSKRVAQRVGNEAATVFPRLFVDADVELSTESVRELARVLRDGGVLACGPRRVLPRHGVGWFVRCYYDIWERLPAVQEGLFGRGAIALSERANQRVAQLPALMADDLCMSEAFSPLERAVVGSAQVVVHPPRTLRDLHRRRVRTATGNAQADRAGLPRPRRSTSAGELLGAVTADPRLLPRLPVFLLVTAAARLSARRPVWAGDFDTWRRDESSRR